MPVEHKGVCKYPRKGSTGFVIQVQEALKSPETYPEAAGGCREPPLEPGGALNGHRARKKDQPAFILTAQAPGKESQT